jgi:branched-chain amino acid transport system ATP-binding protein
LAELKTADGPAAVASTPPRIAVENIVAGYGKRSVLHGITLDVGPGEVVTVLGHNGAGKTTLLKSIFGLLPLREGTVKLDGVDCTGMSTVESVRSGMSYVPAEAPIFRELTIRENLELGAFTVTDADVRRERLERVHRLFPMLAERSGDTAGTLSGGQQRLLSLGTALMSGANLMLLDEPSLGIAPSLVNELFETIGRLCREEGLSILLIEQNVRAALPLADRAYFMRMGRIILEESAEQARVREDWWDLF